MPKAGWKKDFDAFQLKDNRKSEKKTEPPKKKPVSKKPEKKPPLDKPPEKSSLAFPKPPPKEKKKRERIDNGWSETEVFKKIWNSRLHCCQKCWVVMEWALEAFRWIEDAKGEKVQKLIRPECFAHLLAKKMYPKHRLDPRNIRLVCSTDCHKLTDEEYNDLEKRRLLDEELSNT